MTTAGAILAFIYCLAILAFLAGYTWRLHVQLIEDQQVALKQPERRAMTSRKESKPKEQRRFERKADSKAENTDNVVIFDLPNTRNEKSKNIPG